MMKRDGVDVFVENGMGYLKGKPAYVAAAAIGFLMDVYCSREGVDDDELMRTVTEAREFVRKMNGKAVDLEL